MSLSFSLHLEFLWPNGFPAFVASFDDLTIGAMADEKGKKTEGSELYSQFRNSEPAGSSGEPVVRMPILVNSLIAQ